MTATGFGQQARTISVITPENVEVNYQLAGVITRSMALIVDLVIQALLLLCVVWFLNVTSHIGFGLNHILTFIGLIASFCVLLVYNIFFELMWGGRTPGKRLFRLRVLRDGGYPINLISSCIRNILRFIDLGILIAPSANATCILFGTPGLVCVVCSPLYKRIGDYAAGTIVIHEQTSVLAQWDVPSAQDVPRTGGIGDILPKVSNIDRVTPHDYQAIRRFTARRAALEPIVQAAVAEAIARPLLIRMEIKVTIGHQIQYADVLAAIEQRYVEENGLL